MLHYKLINIDFALVILNATSVTTLGLAWFSDNLNSVGGFIVMLSIAYLNFTKACKIRSDEKRQQDN